MNYNIFNLNSPTDGHRVYNDNANNNLPLCGGNPVTPSRSSLAKLPIDEQRQLFCGLNSDNKWKVMSEKIKIVMQTEDLTQNDISHLNSLLLFFRPEYYNLENKEMARPFLVNWEDKAKNTLNWSKEKLYNYVGSIETSLERRFSPVSSDPSWRPGTNNRPPCECASDSNFCSGLITCNSGKNCEPTGWGCGTLWWYGCNGMCGGIGIRPNM